MSKCEKFRELIYLYIDDMLEDQEKQELEEHLRQCKNCQRELEDMQQLINNCRQMEEKEPPEYLTQLIMHNVRKEALKTSSINKIVKRLNLKSISVAAAAMLLFAVIASGVLPHMGFRMSIDDMKSESQTAGEYVMDEEIEAGYSGNGGAEINMDLAADENKLEMRELDSPNLYAGAPKTADILKAPTPDQNRKVIKNANLSLEVEDFDASFNSLMNITEQLGGYVQNSDSYTRKYKAGEKEREFKEGHTVLKIPGDKLSMVIEEIKELGKVTGQSSSGSDVTLQYMDIQARLKSKQVQENRLLEILDKASKVEDILRIENELNRVRTDIEVYIAQLNSWDNLVQYSTVIVNMKEVEQKDKEVMPPHIGNLWERIKKAFIVTTNSILDLIEYIVVGIGYALPVIVVCGAGYLVWRTVKNKRRGRIDE